ncbi:MAG TPA: zinc ribbon domain-containing protein [Ktedonobacteraceae bacterium]|nr:zinc ribbon domain-containing protein [Ktedonobacteraceae bacterium]
MMKPITGQYECVHQSGVGLDYFTSRIDRITLQTNGRFTLIVQQRSRAANAAQALLSGQQVTTEAPEIRREGNYTQQGNSVVLHFDDGGLEQAQVSWNGEGIQIGPNFFNKVSDSTVLPPTHRLKKDMDDIAKGIKIASTIGGMAVKAAKTIQGTIQTVQGTTAGQSPMQGSVSASPSAPAPQQAQPAAPTQPAQYPASRPTPPAAPPVQPAHNPAPQTTAGQPEAIFCDQCGARCRPGKRFCGNCGAQLS